MSKNFCSGTYQDNNQDGVVGYGGKLDIRPPYQREFVYDDKKRNAVIHSINKEFPLNVMYWAVRDDGNFEIIDGQQRTISIAQYVEGDFSFQGRYFNNLQDDEKEIFLNYKLTVYFCSGTDSERLEWFEIINIAGVKLSDQELRNAVYSGSWVSDAKRYFSKRGCVAYRIGNRYLSGKMIRQEYFETAIKWISDGDVKEYMGKHQHDLDAKKLWNYFESVINWVEATFTEYRKEMKGRNWGVMYNELKNVEFDSDKVEEEVSELMKDRDVTNKKGVYSYVLTRKEKHLNIRTFENEEKRESYERQKGICVKCQEHFELSGMQADHIKPWHEGGKTISENCQMLCKDCNRRKSGK